jgi:hypothetical protein
MRGRLDMVEDMFVVGLFSKLSSSLALFLFQFFIVIDGCVGTPSPIPGGASPCLGDVSQFAIKIDSFS